MGTKIIRQPDIDRSFCDRCKKATSSKNLNSLYADGNFDEYGGRQQYKLFAELCDECFEGLRKQWKEDQ